MRHADVERSIPGDYQLRAVREGWRLQRAWHRARLDLVAHLLPPHAEGPVLDAAAGSGILTWRFRRRGIVSVDMRPAACAAVRAHTPRARCVAGLLDALPFRSESFAQVYFLEALEHLEPEEGARALRELHRVARPGASCLLTTPNYRSHWRLIERFLDRFGPTPPMAEGQHVSRYDRHSLVRAAENAGWRVQRTGAFNLVAPFAGALSPAAGAWLTRLEAEGLRAGGPLLFAVAQRPA